MAERKMADALDELYKDGVKVEIQKAKTELTEEINNLSTEIDSKLENKADKGSSDFAPLASPALTGTPTAPTPSTSDNSTRIATTAYVVQKINELINSAPGVLDTLGEIAAALKNNPNVIDNILTQLSGKLDSTTAASTYARQGGWTTDARFDLTAGNICLESSGMAYMQRGSGFTHYIALEGNGTINLTAPSGVYANGTRLA